jgi:quinol monooxygenase YgiN
MSDQHEHQTPRANPQAPVINIVTYVPKPGKADELLALVKKHEPALRKVGLVTAEPFKVWKAYDIRKKREQFIEYFVWKDGSASDIAHQTPEVMAVWEPMGPILEELTICEVEPI